MFGRFPIGTRPAASHAPSLFAPPTATFQVRVLNAPYEICFPASAPGKSSWSPARGVPSACTISGHSDTVRRDFADLGGPSTGVPSGPFFQAFSMRAVGGVGKMWAEQSR